MNKGILKNNIKRVLKQNGETNKICFRHGCIDIFSYVRVDAENIADIILDLVDNKYRDHLVSIYKIGGKYEPLFDTDAQAIWNAKLDKFYEDKAQWCMTHGCD